MGYKLSGTVVIEFQDYETEENDPVEARHEVENQDPLYLLDLYGLLYTAHVTVEKQVVK